MDFEDALRYMNGRLRFGEKFGNERLLTLLERLGNPHERLRVVHVAGTKGKGSTTAMAAGMLQAAGYKVGLYLSPYVYDVCERVQINGKPIPREDFARWIGLIRPHIEALERTEHGSTTEFELKTAVGFCYFAEQSVDYAAIEVGLGGRLDATNVVPRPLVSVITTIGLDHTELLGDTHEQIAREKAGIVKPGAPCVTGVPQGTPAFEAIAEICARQAAPLLPVAADGGNASAAGYRTNGDGTVDIRTSLRKLERVRLRLRGRFQHGNAAVAVAALDAVPPEELPTLSDEAVRRGLETTTLPGRMEKIADRPAIIADGAHNAMAAQVLAEALRQEYDAAGRRLILVLGFKRNHAPEEFLAELAPLRPAMVIATQPSFHPRPAADVAAAAKLFDLPDVEVVETGAVDAVRLALARAAPEDVICLTGSFYLVGDLPPAVWRTLLNERNI